MLKHVLLWDAWVSVSAIICLNICKKNTCYLILIVPFFRDVEPNSCDGPNICAHMDRERDIYIL